MITEQTVPADMAHLRSLLASVDRLCEAAGADRSCHADFMLVVEEALVNVIKHAHAGLPPGELQLSLSCEPWEGRPALRADIHDHGHPYNPLSTPMPDLTLGAEDRPIGGLGVMLMRQLSDVQAYHHDAVQGNHLTLIKFLPVAPTA